MMTTMKTNTLSTKKRLDIVPLLLDYAGMLLVLIGMIIFFSIKSEYFFTLKTFSTIANQIPGLTVIAVGMTYVLIIAGIDLSVGSVMALSGTILSIGMIDLQWGLFPAAIICLLTGLLCGAINGLITVTWTIPPFIVTLGMLEMARGAAYLAADSRTKYIGTKIGVINTPIIGGISIAFIIALVIVILGQIVLRYTVFGRYMIGIGTNEEAIRLSGIDPRWTKIAVFALIGLLIGVAAVFECSRLEAADPNAGVGLELQAIAAVVIGGTSLMGGRGSVIFSFIGVLIISILEAGLAQIGATEPTKRLITGLVIILAVIIDMYRTKYKSRTFE
jgi:ribose transport system permease protein